MNDATDRVQALTGAAAIASLDRLAMILAPAAKVKRERDGDPAEYSDLFALANRDPGRQVADDGADEHAKRLLSLFAAEESFKDAVTFAIDTRDDQMLVTRPILALGSVATLLIIAATTDVEFTVGDVHVHKVAATPELVKALADLLKPLTVSQSPDKDE